MDILTEEQKASFAAINALVGLGPTEYTAQLSPEELSALPGRWIMSDTEDSHFTPHIVTVGSIAELRKIAGFPDEFKSNGGDEPTYPAPPSADELALVQGDSTNLKFSPDDELRGRIELAAQAFVHGDPDKVREYEPLINAALFPGKVLAFTGENLTVPAGQTLVVTSPTGKAFLNYQQITIGAGATIQIDVDTTVNSQIFEQQ